MGTTCSRLHAIDQQIAGGAEHERFGVFGYLRVSRLADALVNVLPEIGDIGLVAPIVLEERCQGGFQRQYLMDEPCLDFGRSHACIRTAQLGVLTIMFRRLCHSPRRSQEDAFHV